MFDDADLIHRYTRADAIRDSVLIDVSATAKEAGFKFPVALTAAVWSKCVEVPPGVASQDEAGRLWDVLTLLRFAIRASKGAAPEVRFGVCVRNQTRWSLPCRSEPDASPWWPPAAGGSFVDWRCGAD